MKRIAVVLLLLASACNKAKEPPAPAPAPGSGSSAEPAPAPAPPADNAVTGAESLARVKKLVDTICACADRACAVAARTEMDEDNKRNAGRPRIAPTAEEAQQLTQQAARIAPCMSKLQ